MHEELKEPKYFIKVFERENALKVSKELQESFKGILSKRMIARMKREVIDCPVLNKERPFLECFVCNNFIRRVKGEVQCAGLPLEE
ncbi:MAG: hypothetical protein RMJ31_02415 [Nitrososphaerota archaeon]|nr:hypothetical protein [Nitrososphaerales archaeon]MDW8044613.1 hypothetical protein [Nitrososphaerota archaeon]